MRNYKWILRISAFFIIGMIGLGTFQDYFNPPQTIYVHSKEPSKDMDRIAKLPGTTVITSGSPPAGIEVSSRPTYIIVEYQYPRNKVINFILPFGQREWVEVYRTSDIHELAEFLR